MLIGYSMPAMTVGITGGTWLTSDNGAALVDGKPARKSRISATSPCAITLTAAAAFKPRIIAVLGLEGVTAGTTITATTSGGVALGSADVVQFADGTLGCWIVNAGSVSTTTVKISIPVTGSIDIGEIVAMAAVELLIDRGWIFDEPGTTARYERTRGAQVNAVGGSDYRRLNIPMAAAPVSLVRGGGLENGMDWYALRAAFKGASRVVAITRWQTVLGAIDTDAINDTAVYGYVANRGSIEHLGGDQYGWSITVEEIPAT